MSEIQRICPQCSQSAPLEARHCPHCGYDTVAGLPAPSGSTLPVAIGKAALPILAAATSLALRAAWKLLQSRLTQAAAQRAVDAVLTTPKTAPAERKQDVPSTRSRRTIRIRSSWMVSDGGGRWQEGTTEHVIELDER